jgi:predicted glycogen debranching enzyme
MEKLIRTIELAHPDPETARELLRREWLLTNGLGGYASGTISGSIARRHHGLLIAALPSPLGRVIMLNHIAEAVRFPGGRVLQISGDEPSDGEDEPLAHNHAKEFRLENGVPVWRFEIDGVVIEKRVLMVHGQNTTHVHYTLIEGGNGVRLDIRPSVHFRRHEHEVSRPLQKDYLLTIGGGRYEIFAGEPYPPLRLLLHGEHGTLTDTMETRDIAYQTEAERGYASCGKLWSPGYFTVSLRRDKPATLVASTEPWRVVYALDPQQAQEADAERRRKLIAQAPEELQHGPAS